MSKVILDMAISVDGFVAGTNNEDHGLHDYFFAPSEQTAAVIEESFAITGAIVMGRRSYELGASQGGFEDNPYDVPTFVLTSEAPRPIATGAESFVFVTDGIESALHQAKAAGNGSRDVVIGGGAATAQSALKAGLIDEIHLHLVPVLIGEGIRLFEHNAAGPIQLESISVLHAPDATHLKFRVIR
jgi:dihydrofolate reductase